MARALLAIMAAGMLASLMVPQSSVFGVMADEAVIADPVRSTSFTGDQLTKLEEKREKFEFQAEVSRLMDIIINSLYTKKDVFLRELISNAADACDKIRFLALSDASLLGTGEKANLEIRISSSKGENTLTIRDRGVGMTKQDIINNLGTVARSGTAAFMEQLASGGDLNLIGQFGVGFYSVYLVADKVRVVTKHNDDKQYVWESSADGTYTVAEDPRGNTLDRGTEITLFLKEDASEFTQPDTLRNLIKRYSEFITFPIHLQTTKSVEVEVPVTDEDAAAAAVTSEDDEVVAAAADGEEDKPKTKKETQEVVEWELVNNQKAIWSRTPENVEDEEYKSFFKAIVKDGSDALTWIHFRAEGEVEFRAILYIPTQPPPEMYDNYYGKSNALRLYVRKVLIADEFEDLLPRYLNFIRGVVDSDDLPLNVSREQLQQGKILKVMAKKLVRKVLEMIRKLAQSETEAKKAKKADGKEEAASTGESGEDGEDGDKATKKFEIPSHLSENADQVYTKFWEHFGKNIKLGVIEDSPNRSKLAKLLRWRTTESGKTGWRSFEEYVANMKEGQKNIYYIAGESWEGVQDSPFLERFAAKGIEVIIMTDPIDEYAVQNLPEFDGHKLQSITKEGLVLPGDDRDTKRREDVYKDQYKPLTEYLKKVYGDKVEKVTVSGRLNSSPAVFVTSQYGYSANMERIMKSQAFADPSRAQFLAAKKTLEINPRHPIIAELKNRAAEDAEATNLDTKDIAKMIYDTALMNSGFSVEDSKDFSARLYRLLKAGLNLNSLDLLPEVPLPPEEEMEEVEMEEVEDMGNVEIDGESIHIDEL